MSVYTYPLGNIHGAMLWLAYHTREPRSLCDEQVDINLTHGRLDRTKKIAIIGGEWLPIKRRGRIHHETRSPQTPSRRMANPPGGQKYSDLTPSQREKADILIATPRPAFLYVCRYCGKLTKTDCHKEGKPHHCWACNSKNTLIHLTKSTIHLIREDYLDKKA